MNVPAGDAPLQSRSDFRELFHDLYEPLQSHFSSGNARVTPGVTGAFYPERDAQLEGFSRLLWGVAPLAAGGYSFDDWDRFRTGLVNGCTPEHAEYWGTAGDYDQQHVEMAAIGVALALIPDELWTPLAVDERRRVASWLGQINDAELHDCNWLFFRVLTNVGLRAVGATHDWDRVEDDLERLDSYALTDGWYADGTDDAIGPRDHYTAWEMHVNGLLYSALTDEAGGYGETFRDRARRFATEYLHWFDDTGRALPYGRSLTYRFAQASFWGALAFAGVTPASLDWGEIRGLWARNVRWWVSQPIFTDGGALSIGYRYPNLKMAEIYNSPSGPYWALKAALPLALSSDHPFWRATEQRRPDTNATVVQPAANHIICRDESMGHQYSLTTGQRGIASGLSTEREKYNKFAYSTAFGVSVESRQLGLSGAGHDSTLVLSRDGRHFRMREDVTEQSVSTDAAYARWTPFDDVAVDTWLIPTLPWHVRVHRVETTESFVGAEGGFAIDRTGGEDGDRYTDETDDATAVARYPAGTSVVADLTGTRDASVVFQDSNVNLMHQRTVVPTLTGELDAGESWLATGVIATPDSEIKVPLQSRPAVSFEEGRFTVTDTEGKRVY
ncbi:DUF2264 domain-containing protein [Halobaculum sp. MBLA0147]|uniref:DUF2264 domain-containing protein n=1 Tax=Halobaculum sp. MBLA0147 TaxID=3079934 RepID=UPI003525E742